MAMQALRIAAKESKFMKFLLGGFIFLAVGGLVFTDINGYFRGGLPNTTVARVGDEEIHIRDFDRELRGFLMQTGMGADEAYQAGLVNAYLQSRIDMVLALQVAEELDIVVGEAFLAQKIRETFGTQSADEIRAVLAARGMSEGQVAQILSNQIKTELVTKLPNIAKNYIPSDLDQAHKRYYSEQRSGTFYTFPAAHLADSIMIDDAAVQQAYEAMKSNYLIPETRVLSIGTISADQIKKSIPAPTDEDVRTAYEDRQDDFIVPEQRTLAQAVVSDPDQAQKIYELASAGTPLKTALVEAGGDESGYRDVASYTQDGLPSELSDAVFTGDVTAGSVLPPVRTLVGWHVIKVTEITPETVKAFESMRDTLRADLMNERLYDALYNRMVETENMVDSATAFAEIAEKTGLTVKTASAFAKTDSNAYPEELKKIMELSPSIIDEVFALQQGGATYPVETGDDSYIVIGVKTVNEAAYKPLDDVRSEIMAMLKQQRTEQQAQQILEEKVVALNAGNLAIRDFAAETKASTKPFKNIRRKTDDTDNVLAFETPQGQYAYAVKDGTVTVAHIDSVGFADQVKDAPDIAMDRIVEVLLRNYHRSTTKITINHELLKAQYAPNML